MAENDSPSQQFIFQFPAHPEYRFSNFIVSRGSSFALACAQELCSGDPVAYQSLYLSGASGLGKTHLLMAIGNHLAETDSNVRALYV
ncbi:MAG: DnaA/Hda family protein, partial [Nitrospinota bacterium]|nr:DnaA/Hda family protein [Nitrospinota bacterium]